MIIPQMSEKALAELINACFDRAAGVFARLLGRPLQIRLQQVALATLAELTSQLSVRFSEDLVVFQQPLSDRALEVALWLVDRQEATILVDLLSGGPGVASHLTASDREALVEVGSVLLAACVGPVHTLLNGRPTLPAPQLHLDVLDTVLTQLAQGRAKAAQVLSVEIQFQLAQRNLGSNVILALSPQTLDMLAVAPESHRSLKR